VKHLISREREKSAKKYGLQRQRQLVAGTSMIFEHPLSRYRPITVFLFLVCARDLENFSVVSVLAFTLPTPGRGAVAVTKDHKKISCLMGPYNTETGNHYIYNHDFDQGWRREETPLRP
jgi:hypothetical protein